ncbi:phage holin family protein [Thalassotalea maritima]|uniref:phage holin family protein n=1 Tax=Thalassotalea maritima TaxID=3242416 RepID=UPI00352902CE
MITKLILLSISIFLVAKVLDGIHMKNGLTAVIVAIVYSVVDLFLWWLLVILSIPLILITFGLFLFIINAFLLWLTDKMLDDFTIKNKRTTLLASLLISGINLLLTALIT